MHSRLVSLAIYQKSPNLIQQGYVCLGLCFMQQYTFSGQPHYFGMFCSSVVARVMIYLPGRFHSCPKLEGEGGRGRGWPLSLPSMYSCHQHNVNDCLLNLNNSKILEVFVISRDSTLRKICVSLFNMYFCVCELTTIFS